ncbi:MAG: hypothetical protein HGA78_07000 [Nitrospirales bacterium]|nr:hypothetical protein [Nitrospirales bacterium]
MSESVQIGPRKLLVPNPGVSLSIPDGMSHGEFFNSPENFRNLAGEHGLLRSPAGWLLYRKAIGHSLTFDASLILDLSQRIFNPMDRPVRRVQLTERQNWEWSRMTATILGYMIERYPDPKEHLILCGEASLDPTWPLNSPRSVPSIRMIHNHFIVFPYADLRKAELADPDNPDLTDGGHHSLFLEKLSEPYLEFLGKLDLKILRPIPSTEASLSLTGYPQGLPSWEVKGGAEALKTAAFWEEYDLVLRGFLDFYHAFFGSVSDPLFSSSLNLYPCSQFNFQDHVQALLFRNDFNMAAKEVRDHIEQDRLFANAIRWKPAYKQMLYRDEQGRLIVTISQNSVGNAITELLGIVVNRVTDKEAYSKGADELIRQLIEVRELLIKADLGKPIHTEDWPDRPAAVSR